jgi:hypothetical protein
MPKYNVTLQENIKYTLTVTADDRDGAEDLALEEWANSEDPTREFEYVAYGAEVIDIWDAEEEEASE